jgi:hypothetical protein
MIGMWSKIPSPGVEQSAETLRLLPRLSEEGHPTTLSKLTKILSLDSLATSASNISSTVILLRWSALVAFVENAYEKLTPSCV